MKEIAATPSGNEPDRNDLTPAALQEDERGNPCCERGDEPPAGLGCDEAGGQHADRDEQQPARDRPPGHGGQRSGERDRGDQPRGQEIRISGCRNLEAGRPAAGVEIARQHRSDGADDEAGA